MRRPNLCALALPLLLVGILQEWAVAANTIFFSPSAIGVSKSVEEWGVDTAWPSFDNVRQSIEHIGIDNVEVMRLTFHPAYPLTSNGDGTYELSSTAKGFIDAQLGLASLAGSKPIALLPGEFSSNYDAVHWQRTIKSTQEYINSRPGFESTQIASIEAFNEPDFWVGQGSPSQLNSLITNLKAYPEFQNTQFPAGSSLNSDNAWTWYDPVPAATQGSSHLLGGSLTNWVNFIEHVKNTGKGFVNPELHSLGEAIVGAEHGMVSGIYWADALRARGLFAQASDGKRLGYFEDLGRQSAAAVYRAPDGEVYAFAGGVERFGQATAYRFVSSEDVYFNGIRVREYMLQTKADDASGEGDYARYGQWPNQGAFAHIDTNPASAMVALDGQRWKIVNAQTGQVLEVTGGGTADGAAIRLANDGGAVNQLWDIVRTPNGYYQLYNTNSGRTAEVAFASLDNGAEVRQWGTADNQTQQWYLEAGENGAFYLRNGHSNKYMTRSGSRVIQWDGLSAAGQQWRFVPANPTVEESRVAHYALEGNRVDETGNYHATLFGSPNFAPGPEGLGLVLDGANDYATLPSGVASSENMTVATWVKWDGGGDWQRIFDFGNDTNSYMFLTPRSGDNTMRFAITTDSNGAEQVLDTDPLPTGEWVHLALTLGGNTGILYVNGEPQVAGQIWLDPADINPTNNYIGKSQWPDALFDGMIDEFQVFDYALDSTQVLGLVYDADYDDDGDVDGNDFLLIQQNQPSLLPLWKQQFDSTGGALIAVPEPSATLLMLLASGLLLAGTIRTRVCRLGQCPLSPCNSTPLATTAKRICSSFGERGLSFKRNGRK